MKVDVARDKTPKVGPDHQAEIPDVIKIEDEALNDNEDEQLWSPYSASRISQQALNSFLTLASSCLVPGNHRNEESALKALNANSGNVQEALLELMSMKSKSESSMSSAWNDVEVAAFYEGLVKHQKNFDRISRHVGSKSRAECVEYYYIWKNVCRDESRSFKAIFESVAKTNVKEENNEANTNSLSNKSWFAAQQDEEILTDSNKQEKSFYN